MYGLIPFNKIVTKDSVINEAAFPDRIKDMIAINTPDNILKSLVFGNECGSPNTKKTVNNNALPIIEERISPEKKSPVEN